MIQFIRSLTIIVLLGSLACGGMANDKSAGPAPGKAGVFPSETVKVGSTPREYRLIVPKSVDSAKPAPLVIAFHGIGIDSKDLMPKYSELDKTAEKHGFILAFPEALKRSWGLTPDKMKADLEFFDALVDKLKSEYKIDAERIYVVGMSNGGYFAHLVGKERSKTVAAVASHSGPLGLQTLGGVNADRKFPVLIAHGDSDKLFPIAIAKENRDKYEKEGHEVKYVELKSTGHAWGTKADINETIWTFFQEHPLNAKK